jgi:malate dehydrogenase
MAYAGARFTNSLLRALNGEKGVVEPTFVQSTVVPGVSFFATNVELGTGGVDKIHPIGAISSFEQKLLDACVPELKKNIEKGFEFASKNL